MAKDTVRYPDTLVEEIGELVDEGVFESKSEYHRFAAEFVLSLLRPERDPSTFSYTELRRELEMDERCRALLSEADADADADGDGDASGGSAVGVDVDADVEGNVDGDADDAVPLDLGASAGADDD